jgi:hypothetical protein
MNYTGNPTEIVIRKVTRNGYIWLTYDAVEQIIHADDYADNVVRAAICKAGLPSGTYSAHYDTPHGPLIYTFAVETVTVSSIIG